MVQQTQDEGLQVQAVQWKCPVQQMQDEDGELEAEWAPDVELVRVAESEQEEREEVLQLRRYPEAIPQSTVIPVVVAREAHVPC